jgi:hypothetical protein
MAATNSFMAIAKCQSTLHSEKIQGQGSKQCIAKLLPMHIFPPDENHHAHRSFFSLSPPSSLNGLSSHRSGLHSSARGKTFSFLCRLYAFAPTLTPPGMFWYKSSGPRVHGVEGVTRGWPPGIAGRWRSVSSTTALRMGRASMDLAEGRTTGSVAGGYCNRGESVWSSARRRA